MTGLSADAANMILVLTSSHVPAYAQALAGITRGLGEASERLTILDLDRPAGSLEQKIAQLKPCLIIALGSGALEVLAAHRVRTPVVSSMVLDRSTGRPPLNTVATISLQVPLDSLLAGLKRTFPGKTRLGILGEYPRGGAEATALQSRAKDLGFSVRIAGCGGPQQMLEALVSLKGQVDFVWCRPNSSLFNSSTVKPLVLASLRQGLPLIGFSESFVRAGAAVGIYADFEEVGCQTAEAARRYLAGQASAGPEAPRKFKLAVNDRVIRLLGLHYIRPRSSEEDFLVLR